MVVNEPPDPPMCDLAPQSGACPSRAVFKAVLAAALILISPVPCVATVPSDLCTGSPCVVTADITVDAGSVLDFTGQSLVFAEGVTVRVGAGVSPRDLWILADDITLEQNARIPGDPNPANNFDGDRAVVKLEAVVGDVVMESSGSNRSQIDVRADDTSAGNITISAAGDAILDGLLDASAVGEDARGGLIDVQASGSVTIGEDVTVSGTGNFAGAGDIDINAGLDVTFDDRVLAEGGHFGGGDVTVFAGGTVTLNDLISTDGGDPDGEAGEIDITAGVDIEVSAGGVIRGRGGIGPDEDCGDGAPTTLDAGNHVIVDGDLDLKGELHCFGGDLNQDLPF